MFSGLGRDYTDSEEEVSDARMVNDGLPGASSIPAKTSTLTNIEAPLTDLKAMKGQLCKSKKELLKLTKDDYPKDIVLLLYSMPVTQVPVELLFTTLKMYKSNYRNRLK